MGQYAQHAGAIFSLKYRPVWCSKRRRRVLVKPVAAAAVVRKYIEGQRK